VTPLHGAFPVLCTPFRDDGTVDEADFRALIAFFLDCDVDGCVFPGVASEVDTLTAEERAGLVAILGEELAGATPFIVGASDRVPEAVIRHMARGQAAGAQAAMVMAPGHLGDDPGAHVGFFEAVAAGADLPIVLQNAPVPIGAGLSPETVAEIARAVPQIRYCKEETMPCGQNLTRIITAARDAIEGVFGGAGGRYITDELARGSLGTMPASEFADLHVALVRAWARGDEAEARRLFEVSMPLLNFQAIFRMHMTKATLARRGVIRHTFVRGKGPRMDAGDRRELHALLDRIAPELKHHPLGPAPADD
jgi:4-hydroxy-tetrahydrodipicolinate synthase